MAKTVNKTTKETIAAKKSEINKTAGNKTSKKSTSTKKTITKKTETSARKKAGRPPKSVARKAENLLIVESPSKAKTIKKYLDGSFEVLSSKGHIRDLPASRLGVDVEHGFEPEYVVSRKDGKTAILKELKTAAANSDKVYLATDPDREGEAIAWHLAKLLGIDENSETRVTFNEITKNAVRYGVEHPRKIDKDLFFAQQTRRVMDRIVGYKLSPLLWKKVRRGLSAGRVQSVVTRLVVERENEIKAFKPEEFWNIEAIFANGEERYSARFYGTEEKKIVPSNEEEVKKITNELDGKEYIVSDIKKQERTVSPRPPFTTSSLQQDASAKLNMRPQTTMRVAQALYEGINVKGRGLTGLITYMRTDSLRISAEASTAAEKFIKTEYGEEYLPKKPTFYKTKEGAQDAHEAIRPTDVFLTPDSIKDSLTSEQYRLYKLIWLRFTASRMAPAIYDVQTVDIKAGDYLFKGTDSVIRFKGYTYLYQDGEQEKAGGKFPVLSKGDKLDFKELKTEQKFTQPPPRYTEASLIRAMEENGIGRPSTYAPTVSTIQERRYVEKEGKSLVPTELGYVTTDIMIKNFNDIVDISFTAEMEKKLDEIEEGKDSFLHVMTEFYTPFMKELTEAEKNLEKVKLEQENEDSGEICELCGAKMVYKVSRYGRFLACSNYPACKNTKSIVVEADGKCPKCGKKMLVRKSKNKGKTYFSCEDYNGCGFMTWDTPTKETCPDCGSTLFRHGSKLVCLKEGCGHEEAEKKKDNKENKE